jgi:outer membrane lipoprotein-sorting protein
MRRFMTSIGASALALAFLAGCGAASDIKDAAQGIASAGKDAEELQRKFDLSKTLTFTATYEFKSKDGKTSEVVVSQKPPKASYKQPDSQLIDDGNRLVNCTKSTEGATQCLDVGPHTETGLYGFAGGGAGFGFAFNPATFIGLYTTAAIVPGVEAGKDTRDIAGQKSDCVSIKITEGADSGKRFEGCTTEDGVFTFSDDGEGNVATLTKFERSADDSAFVPPVKPKTQDELIADATSTTKGSSDSSTTSTSIDGSSSTTCMTFPPNISVPPGSYPGYC